MNAEVQLSNGQDLEYQFLSYRELLRQVNEHAYRYYVLDQPVV
jgi:NAD-dependent DNA ligase